MKTTTVYFTYLAYVLFCFTLISGCADNKPTIRPCYTRLTQAVYASGNLLPVNEYKVFSQADGILLNKAVAEGDTVSKGQLLFELENNKQNIRSQNALEQYRIARDNALQQSPVLQELEAALATAKARWQTDSVNHVRYTNLLENKATSRMEYDRVALAHKTAKNEYISLKNRLDKTRTQLQLELQNAKAQYKLHTEQTADYAVKSRINGVVFEIYKEAGELIKPNEPIALLADPSQVYLKLTVDELDIDKIKKGQEVLVKIDTYPHKIFKARISKTYPMLNQKDQSFRVDAQFTDDVPRVYAGLTVEANIIIQQKEQALTIPKTYLIGQDSVRIEKDGKAQQVKITKGVENFEYVEVLAGVDTTSVLLMSK